MPGDALSLNDLDPAVLLVEPDDDLTNIAACLEEAGVQFDRHTAIVATADSAAGDDDPSAGDDDPSTGRVADAAPDADLLVVAARALPAGGLDEARRALGVDPDVPALLVGDSTGDVSLPETDAAAVVTWPVSSAAVLALVRGLARDPSVARGRVRPRAPAGATPAALYAEVMAAANHAFEAARSGGPPDLGNVRLLAERIHSHLLRDNGLVLQSLEPHAEFDLASHSANVAVIAGKIAVGMALGVEDVIRVILAGIVHDIGMVRLPDGLVRKPGRLDEEERDLLRTHPVLGAELLADVEPRYAWLESVILQEHERMHGQGYPSGLAGDAIDPLAQIIGLADVFEALSHPRAYRSPYTALEALEQVSEMKGEYFEAGVVAALVNEISAFPLDSYVQLSSGEIAQVVGTNPDNILRPEVLVRWDPEWTPLEPPRRLDLTETPELTVARALLEAELPIT